MDWMELKFPNLHSVNIFTSSDEVMFSSVSVWLFAVWLVGWLVCYQYYTDISD